VLVAVAIVVTLFLNLCTVANTGQVGHVKMGTSSDGGVSFLLGPRSFFCFDFFWLCLVPAGAGRQSRLIIIVIVIIVMLGLRGLLEQAA